MRAVIGHVPHQATFVFHVVEDTSSGRRFALRPSGEWDLVPPMGEAPAALRLTEAEVAEIVLDEVLRRRSAMSAMTTQDRGEAR